MKSSKSSLAAASLSSKLTADSSDVSRHVKTQKSQAERRWFLFPREIQVWHRQHPYPHALWDSDQQYILKLDALSWKRSKVLEVFLVSQESMFREAESEVEKPG